MLFSVLKATSNSEGSCPVVVWHNVFTPAVGKPDGFKGLLLGCLGSPNGLIWIVI